MFSWRNKKIVIAFRLKKVPYLELYRPHSVCVFAVFIDTEQMVFELPASIHLHMLHE